MKLLGLHLLAYGPFTNVDLDLVPEGVHVVYGKNEAGKSTALRAITGLLFGIAKNTPDAHVHKMPDLRVGGSFRLPGGGSVYLVRRKGKENTLLDREGRPVDEAVLARLLGGVSEEQFLTMFGLDHESLRRGGEALLLGKGDVGESLFGAAVAGGEVHQVLRALRAEADALFTPKAHTRPLNEAIKSWTEAHRRTRDESMSPESMLEQERALSELKRERADCDAERQRLEQERAKLQRVCQALPIVARLGILRERRAAMGDVVLLPLDAPAQRTEQTRALDDAGAEIARLEALEAELLARRATLVVPETLVGQEELPLDLRDRLGSHRKAAQDAPRIEAQVRELEADARDLMKKAGRTADLREAEAWRIDAVAEATIRRLVAEKTALDDREQQTRRLLEECSTELATLSRRRDHLAPALDVGILKQATSRAERAGPLDDRLAKALAQVARLELRTAAQQSSLGLAGRSLEVACGLPVPSEEMLDRFERSFALLDREDESVAKQAADADARAAKLAREIQALELQGKVPTERELTDSREKRDASWQSLRRGVGGAKAPREAHLTSYEAEVKAADDLADRLRREAERVGKLAALVAERDGCIERRAALADKATLLARRREEQSSDWRAEWRAAGITPTEPSEMKAWLGGYAALGRTADELRSVEAEVAAIRSSIEQHREPIADLLKNLGAPSTASLGHLLDRAHEVIESAERAAAERRELTRAIEECESRLAGVRAQERENARVRAKVDQTWDKAVAPLGTAPNAPTDEVTVLLGLLTDMFHKMDLASGARGRLAGIERDAAAFAADVRKIAEEHAPDVADRPAEDAAAAIVERYHRGQRHLVERRSIDQQLAEIAQWLVRHRQRRDAAESRLAELRSRARVATIRDLELAEQRSAEARELDQQLADVDGKLLGLGLSADALPEEVRALDLDAATARLEDVDEAREQVRQRGSMLDQRIGGHEAGQRRLEDPQAGAAQAALDAEAALAKVRELAERYARVKVASVVLAREIERYRQENQGPILKRASALFSRLTLGSFSALKTDIDERDHAVLVGVRVDGRDVRVDGMSDGTRDQLYLALYLATLERFAKGSDPMPLIVDDVLIHFDDDRARAALAVLGELSEHTQVLFFTHHARLVELAREAIPRARLFVRELSDTGSDGRSVVGSPA